MLTGKVNPSGRLAETIPHRLEDNSSYLNFPGDSQVVRYGEGLFIGYRGYDKAEQDVAFPFGFGLSYTTFALSDLQVNVRRLGGRRHPGRHRHRRRSPTPVTVDGAEVVQVYVQDVESSVARPVRELKGFAKVVAGGRGVRDGVDRAGPARVLVLVGAAGSLGGRGGRLRHRGRARTRATCR